MNVESIRACRDELNSIFMTKVAIRQVASDIDWDRAVAKRPGFSPSKPGMSPGSKAWRGKALQAQKASKWGNLASKGRSIGSPPSAGKRLLQKGVGLLKRVV